MLDTINQPSQLQLIEIPESPRAKEVPSISPCAFEGYFTPTTLRLEGKLYGQIVTMLIDGGSTHNFTQTHLDSHLALTVEQLPHTIVTI